MIALGEVLELAYGKALKESDRDGGEIPVVGSGGVVGGHSAGITDSATIVVGRKGSIGSVTWIDGPAWPIDTAYFVKPRTAGVDLRWAFWLLKSLPLGRMNKSAAVPGLNRDDVYRLNVHFPSLDDQRRIAAILDHATAILDQTRRLRGAIELAEGSIYRAAVVGVGASASLSELVDDEDRINYGIVQPGEDVAGGVPMIRVADLSGGVVRRDNLKRVSGAIEASYKRSRLRGNEILVSCVGSIGQVALVEAVDIGSNVARAISRVPIADSNLRSFVAAALRSQDVQRYWKSEVRTVAQPTLNVKQLAATRIPLVARRDLEDFSRRMHAVNELRKSAELREGLAQSLVTSLRARAFRGEL